ncbi:hypothetical protein [Vibrio porteresiae]|uniref:Uncharacterized protein n=1 Tax=Vibrio porteresiae DSM 19223 TaxID=1123496 RepID=A0ABZ0QB13_9VIBR|nr:hypothetical protein [Vibrio porteresiae]WPC72967.1 hypothetical protein R8Z52_12615 [Vibrio porteresiae DSM 19223]
MIDLKDQTKLQISKTENEIRADAVANFVGVITGAYCSGLVDNHPTTFDIHNTAVLHVKTRYGVDIPIWDDEDAKRSRTDTYELGVEALKTEIANLRDWLQHIAVNSGNENEVIDAVQSALCGEARNY